MLPEERREASLQRETAGVDRAIIDWENDGGSNSLCSDPFRHDDW
jgi:hypothetical protein